MPKTIHPPNSLYLKILAASLGLIALSYIGLYFLGTAELRPSGLLTLLMILPALIVLPGLLIGHYKTMIWAALATQFYLLLSATDAWASPDDRLLHVFIALLSCIGFISAWWYSIERRRYLKSR